MDTQKISKIILAVGLCISVALNIAIVFMFVKSMDNCNEKTASLEVKNEILGFTQNFVEKILMASRDIDFDTRLELETEVRSLGNEEILNQWQKFTKSTTKTEASNEAKNLLKLLVDKSSAI
jgi:hypothetical protein